MCWTCYCRRSLRRNFRRVGIKKCDYWCSYYSCNCQQKWFDSETCHLGKWKHRIEDSTQVRNMCCLFSLKFPLAHWYAQKSWAIRQNFYSWIIKWTKTAVKMTNSFFCISICTTHKSKFWKIAQLLFWLKIWEKFKKIHVSDLSDLEKNLVSQSDDLEVS